jgi:hypothetical protein
MKALIISILSLFILSGCDKETTEPEMCFDGVVRWHGDPAADGLGWTIYKDDNANTTPFTPRNLSDEYKVNNLKVHVCMYRTEEKFYCHCVQPLDKYHITSIRRR